MFKFFKKIWMFVACFKLNENTQLSTAVFMCCWIQLTWLKTLCTQKQ